MYVEDLAQLIPRIVKEYDDDNCLLIAPAENLSIDNMANIIIQNINPDLTIKYNNMYNGQHRKDVSTEQMKKYFPEFFSTSFEQGVKATIQWYKNETSKK